MFGKDVRLDVLERVVAAADGLASYTLSSIANQLPDAWHGAAVTQLRSKTPSTATNDILQVLESLARRGKEANDVYALRGFSTVLQATLRYTEASVADAERWLAYAQALPEGASLLLASSRSCADVLPLPQAPMSLARSYSPSRASSSRVLDSSDTRTSSPVPLQEFPPRLRAARASTYSGFSWRPHHPSTRPSSSSLSSGRCSSSSECRRG